MAFCRSKHCVPITCPLCLCVKLCPGALSLRKQSFSRHHTRTSTNFLVVKKTVFFTSRHRHTRDRRGPLAMYPWAPATPRAELCILYTSLSLFILVFSPFQSRPSLTLASFSSLFSSFLTSFPDFLSFLQVDPLSLCLLLEVSFHPSFFTFVIQLHLSFLTHSHAYPLSSALSIRLVIPLSWMGVQPPSIHPSFYPFLHPIIPRSAGCDRSADLRPARSEGKGHGSGRSEVSTVTWINKNQILL